MYLKSDYQYAVWKSNVQRTFWEIPVREATSKDKATSTCPNASWPCGDRSGFSPVDSGLRNILPLNLKPEGRLKLPIQGVCNCDIKDPSQKESRSYGSSLVKTYRLHVNRNHHEQPTRTPQ